MLLTVLRANADCSLKATRVQTDNFFIFRKEVCKSNTSFYLEYQLSLNTSTKQVFPELIFFQILLLSLYLRKFVNVNNLVIYSLESKLTIFYADFTMNFAFFCLRFHGQTSLRVEFLMIGLFHEI